MVREFSSASKAEWWFAAPSGKYLQWHFPANREATVSLKARLMRCPRLAVKIASQVLHSTNFNTESKPDERGHE